jgi:hypothetical protein
MKGKRPLFLRFEAKQKNTEAKQSEKKNTKVKQSCFASKKFKRNRRTLLGTKEKVSIIKRYVEFVISFLTKSV